MTPSRTPSHTRSRTHGTTAAAATVLALALALGGCGSGGEQGAPTRSSAPAATGTGPYPTPDDPRGAAPLPAGSGGTPRGGVTRPGDTDQRDADAVSWGALKVMWTFDTTIDSGPGDASVRAADAGWLTEAYAARVREHRPRSVPGAQWREWVGHRASTIVTLEKAEDAAMPADTDTEAWRQWVVTTSPQGRDGWAGEPTTVVAFVRLTRTAPDEAWRVADVTVQ
ncbi:hypothetical protein [Streptomyces sp. NBC_00286]|uniref:hypothetical protein n=1 Tax=Streptomyces sp. NBC_00286 TaxID=2975701 RepID=UPI002E2978A1|nr:hypothetical protein [Streptomyces sp. NBC_00286]